MTPLLLAITPGDARPDLAERIAALGGAGLSGVVIREPDIDRGALDTVIAAALAHVPRVMIHASTAGASALSDRPELGVHLPGSIDVAGARARGWIGRSCHTAAQVDHALHAGADYVVLSPVWRPTSKPADRRAPLGPDRFVAIAAGRPVLALGGVTPERFGALVRRNIRGAAVLGSLFEPSTAVGGAARCRAFFSAARSTKA